jgi:hypothetical protein
MMIMVMGIKSSLVKLILDQINFTYIILISFVVLRSRILSAKREEEFRLCSYITVVIKLIDKKQSFAKVV